MILGDDYVDLAPLFSAHSTRNYLLSTLDFTDSVGATSHKAAVSQPVETDESLFNRETSHFSSRHNMTKREQGKEYLIEIPYFLRENLIEPQGVQGRRKPDTDFREILTDIYAGCVAKHSVAFQRTKESVLAASLFSDKTYMLKTDDILIGWGKLLNVSAMKATVNASNTDTTKIFKEPDQIATDIIEKAQNQAAAIERIAVFYKPEASSVIRFSVGMTNAFQYVGPLEERNVVYQRRDLLPGVTTSTIPGTNIDVIKLVDPLHLTHVTADAIAIPRFARGSNVYQNIYGVTFSTFELINADPTEVHGYSYEPSRGDAVDVVTENSQMVVNHGVDFSIQITIK